MQYDITTEVLAGTSDHSIVYATFDVGIDYCPQCPREVWLYHKADWKGLECFLNSIDWTFLDRISPDDGAQRFHSIIQRALIKYIPRKTVEISTGSHPWFNDTCRTLLERKRAAWGTDDQARVSQECSNGIFKEFLNYVEILKTKLRSL